MDTRSRGKTFARDEQEKENQEERFTSRLQGSRRQWQFGGRATFCPSPRDLSQKGQNSLGKGLTPYTLHKLRRQRFETLPVVAEGMDHQWVADLVEVQKLAKYNRGYRYLLTVIDVVSKYA